MKKTLALGLIFSLLVLLLISAEAVGSEQPEIELESEAAVLMNAQTGEVIYEKRPHQPQQPASIVKIMTMLLTMEAIEEGRVSLDDKITVSEQAASMGGSQIWLEPGEVMTLDELLKAVAVVSANDACVAIAEHVYGTESEFVKAMNKKAQSLGLKNTKFNNTNGLPVDEPEAANQTTAYDVAVMSWALMEYPLILDYTSIWTDSLREGESFLRNTNDLVRFYDGADGLKTGHTDQAGFCLSATAERDGMRFISVILDAPSSEVRFAESKELLSYGFNMHRSVPIVEKEEVVGEVSVFKGQKTKVKAVAEEKLQVIVEKGAEKELVKQSRLEEEVIAPIEPGDKVGEIVVLRNENVVDRVNLVAKSGVERAGLGQIVIQLFQRFVSQLLNFVG